MIRAAVATTDGKVVNSHFGKATKFLIFDISSECYELIDIRENIPACSNLTNAKGSIDKTISLIGDCDYVLISRIGGAVIQKLESKGMVPIIVQNFISECLKQLMLEQV